MESLKDIVARQQRARPQHDDPLTNRLLAELVGLAEEVCVLRDRLDTCEQLASRGEPVDAAAIDAFKPTTEMTEQRLASHRAFFEALLARVEI